MRAWLPIVFILSAALTGCPALLSDWKISGGGAGDAGREAAGGGSGDGGSGGSTSSGPCADGKTTTDCTNQCSIAGPIQCCSGVGKCGCTWAPGAFCSGTTASGGTDGGAAPPSCQGLPATCGPAGNESCCTSPLVTGGTFYRSYDGVTSGYTSQAYPATVSDFRLDKYEITVGRFRKFVAAYSQNMIPAGAGKNPNNPSDPGWDTTWTASLPADATALSTAVQCSSTYQTWTGGNDNQPMNCIDWYQAFAFCIWDGGRLPTEAEWNYAAAGGSEQRVYPWGSTAPGATANFAVFDCDYNGISTGTRCTGVSNIAPVGSASAGNGKYGQADLAGNVWEWTRDAYAPYSPSCANCADTTEPGVPVLRGGAFMDPGNYLLSSYRYYVLASDMAHYLYGARCARSAP